MARYVAGEPWDDPELRDLLSRSLLAAQSAAAEYEGDARIFYERGAAILHDIHSEISGESV